MAKQLQVDMDELFAVLTKVKFLVSLGISMRRILSALEKLHGDVMHELAGARVGAREEEFDDGGVPDTHGVSDSTVGQGQASASVGTRATAIGLPPPLRVPRPPARRGGSGTLQGTQFMPQSDPRAHATTEVRPGFVGRHDRPAGISDPTAEDTKKP